MMWSMTLWYVEEKIRSQSVDNDFLFILIEIWCKKCNDIMIFWIDQTTHQIHFFNHNVICNWTSILQYSSIIVFHAEISVLIYFDSIIFMLIRRLVQKLLIKWTFLTIWVIIVFLSKMSAKYKFSWTYFWYLCI